MIEMVKPKRKQSIGFSYTAGETPSHQAGDDINDNERGGGGPNGTNMFRCSCNAVKIEEELLVLREATTHALSQAWDDIEELRNGASMRMAEIETLENIITDVETEQVYITGQIERKTKEIERKKNPKRRPSLAGAFSRSLSFVGNIDQQGNLLTRSCRSFSMGMGPPKSDQENLLTRSCRSLSMSMGPPKSDQGNLLTRSCRSISMGLGALNLDRTSHSCSLDFTSHSNSLDAPLTEPSSSLQKNKKDKAKLPALIISDGDDTSSESFISLSNATDKRESTAENDAVQAEIKELKMKIRQREETMQSLESTIFENMEIVQSLQKRMISWNQISLEDD